MPGFWLLLSTGSTLRNSETLPMSLCHCACYVAIGYEPLVKIEWVSSFFPCLEIWGCNVKKRNLEIGLCGLWCPPLIASDTSLHVFPPKHPRNWRPVFRHCCAIVFTASEFRLQVALSQPSLHSFMMMPWCIGWDMIHHVDDVLCCCWVVFGQPSWDDDSP